VASWVLYTILLMSLSDSVNKIIGALNKIQVEIPEWVPEWGGKTWRYRYRACQKAEQRKRPA